MDQTPTPKDDIITNFIKWIRIKSDPTPERGPAEAIEYSPSSITRNSSGMITGGSPPMDIRETDDDYILIVDAPGYSKEEISISVTENTIEFIAEREKSENGYTVVQEERPTRIRRKIRLPVKVNIEESSAEYDQGSCWIILPKVEKIDSKSINLED